MTEADSKSSPEKRSAGRRKREPAGPGVPGRQKLHCIREGRYVSEKDLVLMIKADNDEAINYFYERYFPRICKCFGTFAKELGPEGIEDIAQSSLIRTYGKIRQGNFDPEHPNLNLWGYVARVARSLTMDALKRSNKERRLKETGDPRNGESEGPSFQDESGAEEAETSQRKLSLLNKLREIPEIDRWALFLRYEGYSDREIRRAIKKRYDVDIKSDTLRQRRKRLLDRLKEWAKHIDFSLKEKGIA